MLKFGGRGAFYYLNLHNRSVMFWRKVRVWKGVSDNSSLLSLLSPVLLPGPFLVSVHLFLVNLFDLNILFSFPQTFC